MDHAEALVLIQVHGTDLGEIQVTLLIPLDQLLVGADGAAAGGKPQHGVGLQNNLSGNDVGSLTADIMVVFSTDNTHMNDLLSLIAQKL